MHGGFDDNYSFSDTKMFFPHHQNNQQETAEGPAFKTLCSDDTGPSARGYHTAIYVPKRSNPSLDANYVYTFGGQARLGGWGTYMFFNNVHRLNLSTMEWSLVQPANGMDWAPAPRSQSFGFTWRGKIYIYGGYDGRRVYNDLHCFDPITRNWRLVEVAGTNSSGLRGLKAQNFYTFLCRPSGLLLGNDRLVLLTEHFDTSSLAIYILDLVQMRWQCMTGRSFLPFSSGVASFNPPSRGNPTLARCGEHLYVIGGEARDFRNTSYSPSAHLWQLTLPKKMSWSKERLLWLACIKNDRAECNLAKVPPHVIYKIVGYVNSGAFFLRSSHTETLPTENTIDKVMSPTFGTLPNESEEEEESDDVRRVRSNTMDLSPPPTPVKVN